MEDQTLSDKIRKLDEKIEAFQKQLGLSNTNNIVIDEVLSWDRKQIEALQPLQCSQIIAEIAIFNYHMLIQTNKNNARLAWIEDEYKKYLAECIGEFDKFNLKGQEILALKDNLYLQKLHNYRTQFKTRQESVSNITICLNNISEALKQVSFAKRDFNNKQPYIGSG